MKRPVGARTGAATHCIASVVAGRDASLQTPKTQDPGVVDHSLEIQQCEVFYDVSTAHSGGPDNGADEICCPDGSCCASRACLREFDGALGILLNL